MAFIFQGVISVESVSFSQLDCIYSLKSDFQLKNFSNVVRMFDVVVMWKDFIESPYIHAFIYMPTFRLWKSKLHK